MFIGRNEELNALEQEYIKDDFKLQVIYGRRRVGKTTLINKFIENKKHIFFTATESSNKDNLQNLSKAVMNYTNSDIDISFSSFDDVLEYVYEISKEERLVLVIDEYPYLAASFKPISSILQRFIDTKFKNNTQLYLILCGSSMSFMEEQVLGYKSPLYGRRTQQFKIQHFEFDTVTKFYKNFTLEELAIIYGFTGGIPMYLSQIDDQLPLEENIKNIFLYRHSYLLEEPSNLLKQEVREPAIYNSIITAIANGSTKLNEISSAVGLQTSTLNNYLKSLITLDILFKEVPIISSKKNKTIYIIQDNMFKFWYKFIPKNYSLIQRGIADLAYINIEKYLNEYMGFIFEDICKEWLWKENKESNITPPFYDLGRWWGNNPKEKNEEEIDIVAIISNNEIIVGECKWNTKDVSKSVLDNLVRKSNILNQHVSRFYLFSKTGFTDGCIEEARRLGNVELICFKNMY